MNGTEILTLLNDNLPAISTAISPIIGAIFTVVYLRSNTSVQEFEKIKSGKFGEVAEELLESGKMSYSEFYKAKNFLQVAEKADRAYSNMNHDKHSASYEFDWFIRFYETVGSISDDTMQNLWAKILAGEINAPTSYSLKTIDVLKNVTSKDAELFKKICSHSYLAKTGYFIPNYKDYLKSCGIQFDEIMKLSDLDLLNNHPFLQLITQIDTNNSIMCSNRNLLMTTRAKDEQTKECRIQHFPFTGAGTELAKLINETVSDEDFLNFGRVLSKNPSIEVGIHRIISYNENVTTYENENLLISRI